MLLVGEYPCTSCFHPPLLIERLHATHEISKLFLSKLLSKLLLISDPSNVNQKHPNILFPLLYSNPCKIFDFLKSFCSDDPIYDVFMVCVNITRDVSIHTCSMHRFQEKYLITVPTSKNRLLETLVITINSLSISSRILC